MVKLYRFDEELKSDPVEYWGIYEPLKVGVVLLVTVRISPLRLGSGPYQISRYAEARAVVDDHEDPAVLETSCDFSHLVHRNDLRHSWRCRSSLHFSDPTKRSAPLAHTDYSAVPQRVYQPVLQRFNICQPGIAVTVNVAQPLAFPADKLPEVILPSRKFNLKERTVIEVMANVGFYAPY